MVLHTLNALPSSAAFEDCIKLARPDDAIVLMGDGVYAAVEGTEACCLLQSGAAKLFLLDADAQAAGISKPAGDFSRIDMDGLVVLTEQYLRQLAWY